MSTASITQNGVVTNNPTYPYYTDGYNSTWNGAAFVANDLADIRSFASNHSIIPSQNMGEDRKDYDWRVAKAIMSWIANTYPYEGINSDNTHDNDNEGYRAINFLNQYNSVSLMVGGAFNTCDHMTHAFGVVELAGSNTNSNLFHSLPTATANTDPGAARGPSGTVNAMCTFKPSGSNTTYLVVAGNFSLVKTAAGDLTVNNIALWDGLNWTALGSGTVGVSGGAINALAVYNNKLYVGGAFTSAGASVAHTTRLATWDGSAWASVDGSTDLNGAVNALFVFNSLLYIGGAFTNTNLSRLITWNNSAYAAAYTTTAPTGQVFCFGTYNSNLVVGGVFAAIDGTPVNHVSQWNGSAWLAMGSPIPGISTGLLVSNAVKALYQVGSGNLAASGPFAVQSGALFNGTAQWDGSSWAAMGTAPGADNVQRSALLYHNGVLYMGTNASTGAAGKYIHYWDGSAWQAVGDGTSFNGAVNSLCEYQYHWACGTLAKMFIGLCVAHGIPARLVSGVSPNNDLDALCEVYDPRNNKWVFFYIPYYGWVESATSVPQSGQEIMAANDAGSITVTNSGGLYSFTATNGMVGMPQALLQCPIGPKISIPWWCGASSNSNRMFYHVTADYTNRFNNNSTVGEQGTITYDPGLAGQNGAFSIGQVSSVKITNAGSGYNAGTYALSFSGGGGTGAAGTYTAAANGTITSATVTAAGTGYTSDPAVAFPSGGGSNAAGTAYVYGVDWVYWNDTNISYPLNQIQATVSAVTPTTVTFTFTNNIDDQHDGFVVDHYEKSTDNGTTWTTISLSGGTTYVWTVVGTVVWFRGVSASGAVSPTVKAVFAAQPGIRSSIGRPSMARPRTNGLPAGWRS